MRRFEELAWSQTPRGEISLHRRIEPTLEVDVYEVELARLGLAQAKGEHLDDRRRRDARGHRLARARAAAGRVCRRAGRAHPAAPRELFELAASPDGFDPEAPGRTFDAVLLDIDHTPHHLLHPDHAPFYSLEGLGRLKAHLRTDGVFALWSDDPPDEEFMTLLRQVFDRVEAHVVAFDNFLTGGESSNTVHVAV